MGDTTRGLYKKFIVERTDGGHLPRRKHDGCPYFVLDVRHDDYAKAALTAYANACEMEYPLLAADIRQRLLSYHSGNLELPPFTLPSAGR